VTAPLSVADFGKLFQAIYRLLAESPAAFGAVLGQTTDDRIPVGRAGPRRGRPLPRRRKLRRLPAAAAEGPPLDDLSNLSLEQLADIQVNSVSKRDEPLGQAPAAVFVITRDDIRRSGATSLPEALRLAPNLDVVRMNTAAYTVTARGVQFAGVGQQIARVG